MVSGTSNDVMAQSTGGVNGQGTASQMQCGTAAPQPVRSISFSATTGVIGRLK